MAISENILEAIYKSRKVIVVLSQNFLRSMWGQFELSQALNRAVIQVNDIVIRICGVSLNCHWPLTEQSYR